MFSPEDAPRIVASCASCGLMFDATAGLNCPTCQTHRIAYAWKSKQPAEFWNRGATDRRTVSFCMTCYREGCRGDCQANRAAPIWANELAPLSHALNRYGTDCETDCPACVWALDRKRAQPAVDELERMFKLEDLR